MFDARADVVVANKVDMWPEGCGLRARLGMLQTPAHDCAECEMLLLNYY